MHVPGFMNPGPSRGLCDLHHQCRCWFCWCGETGQWPHVGVTSKWPPRLLSLHFATSPYCMNSVVMGLSDSRMNRRKGGYPLLFVKCVDADQNLHRNMPTFYAFRPIFLVPSWLGELDRGFWGTHGPGFWWFLAPFLDFFGKPKWIDPSDSTSLAGCFFFPLGRDEKKTSLYISEITFFKEWDSMVRVDPFQFFGKARPRPGFSQVRLIQLKPFEELGAIQRTHGEFPSSIAISKAP